MMTAEQFEMSDYWADYAEGDDANTNMYVFAESYAAAQLAEKEREIARLNKHALHEGAKNAVIRAQGAEQRLQGAQAAHERIATCLLPIVGTSDGTSVSCAQLAVTEIKELREGWAAQDANVLKLEKLLQEADTLRLDALLECVELRDKLRQREAELEQRWIAVGQRLPEKDGWYLVRSQHYEQSCSVAYQSGVGEGKRWSRVDVTHWQPLPSPPKEAKSWDGLSTNSEHANHFRSN